MAAPGVGLWSRSVTLTIIAELSFVCMGAFVKMVSPTIPLFEIVFFRAITSVVIVSPLMLATGISFRIQNLKMVSIRSLAAFISMACNFYAIGHLALGDAYLLVMSFPLFVAIFSFIFLKTKPTLKLILLILTSWAGILVILKPELHLANVAGLVALTAALFASIDVLTLHLSHQTDHALRLTFYLTALASVLSLPPMIPQFVVPSLFEGLALLLAGAFATLAQIAIARAYGIGDISRLAPLAYIAVVCSYAVGVLLFEEIPSVSTIFGGALTIFGCIQIARMKKTSRSQSDLPSHSHAERGNEG